MQSESNKLIGLHTIVEISEPWEVSVAFDHVTIKATIEKINNSEILLRLQDPIKIKESLCDCLVAIKRYERDIIQNLLCEKRIAVAMTPILLDVEDKCDPFELAARHRGLGLIGTISLVD